MHKIKNITISAASLIMVCFGILIEDRGLAVLIGRDGEPVYPISSGSDDGLLLKAGLSLFIVSAIFALVSFLNNDGSRISSRSYWLNNIFFAFCLFLVSLDTNLISAATLGDWLPLAAVSTWLSSIIAYVTIILFLRKRNA
jgi:hypothetical protein